jgi:CubicO group peptidase (beta-lactamase class C family)
MLVEDGKLDRTAPMTRHIPDIAHALRPGDLALTVFLAPNQSRIDAGNVGNRPIDADSR